MTSGVPQVSTCDVTVQPLLALNNNPAFTATARQGNSLNPAPEDLRSAVSDPVAATFGSVWWGVRRRSGLDANPRVSRSCVSETAGLPATASQPASQPGAKRGQPRAMRVP